MIQGLTLWALLAAAPAPIDDVLARPISPGSLALLVEHGSDPRVIERWSAGLRDTRPEVRAAAARLARVSHSGALAEGVRTALQGEADDRVASELRAALLTVVPEDVELALGDGQRRGALGATLLQLAQVRGVAALTAWPRIRALESQQGNLVPFLTAAARSNAKALGVLGLQAIREQDAVAWAAVLEAERRLGVWPDTGLATAAVRAGGDLAEAAVVRLALSDGQPAVPLVEALKEARPELGQRPAAAVALELLDRRAGQPHHDLRPLLEQLRLRPDSTWLDFWEVSRQLDEAERRALRPDAPQTPAARPFDPESLPAILRLAGGYPPGFVADTLAVTGCAARKGQPVGGRVEYRADGTTSTVAAFDNLGGGAACVRAARALFASYVLPELARATLPSAETLMIVNDADSLACSAQAPAVRSPLREGATRPGSLPHRVSGRIQEPRKVKSVPPEYPQAEKQRRIQGVVILEALLTPTGCVSDLRVLHSAHPRLDLAALVAVSEWRYTPTLLNDVPVPVTMTVTINFKVSSARQGDVPWDSSTS